MAHGVKGSDVFNSTGNSLLDLSVMLNRGLSSFIIQIHLKKIFASGTSQDKIDAFVLAYHTRDIRGGKGERDLFIHMIIALNANSQLATEATLHLIPEYGCWRDVFKLMPYFRKNLSKLVIDQLNQDETLEHPSLLAKWLPREHNTNDKEIAMYLAKLLEPNKPKAQELYRKRVSALNKKLNTVEIDMCANHFENIEPSKVPGRALKLYTRAFLNQPATGFHSRRIYASKSLDRIMCARNFTDYLALASQGKAKIIGANTVFPHELVAKVLADDFVSDAEHDAIEAQWQTIVKSIKEQGALSNTLAMCDFSGSMTGTPMNVSMALGLIIAECNTGIFKDHILTFDSKPTLHKFTATTLIGRVNEVRHLAQGMSTDFQAAYNLVIQKMKEMCVQVGQEPKDLIVLTDIGWDQACGFDVKDTDAVKTKPFETHIQIIQRAFQQTSELLFGIHNKWEPPRIVIWNLRAPFNDFNATNTELGVVQLSGWSPSLLNVIITKGIDAFTPQAMLRAQLDDERYDPVRLAVSKFLV